jgi:DNA-directed DNA polymerase III PolC
MYLNCHTAFSFQYGTMPVETLFDEARRCGVHKLVLTEINNTASYIEMLRLCAERHPASTRTPEKAHALDITVGVEFRHDNELFYIIIAKNITGFEYINRFLSHHNQEQKKLPPRAPQLDDTFIVYPFGKFQPDELRENEFIGVSLQHLTRLATHPPLRTWPHKFVIAQPVTFTNKIDFNVHRLLRAIANNTLLSKLPELQQAQPDEIMIPESQLEKRFDMYPQLIQNTRWLLDQCHFDMPLHTDKNKKQITGSETADWELLQRESLRGLQERYAIITSELKNRLRHELEVIRKKNFCSYYLIAYDLIQYARRMNFDYVGRGSGANSMVAFCLGITNVDPMELNLYFERFLNEERTSPPDFDIDFSWDNRDAIYEYLFSRYGSEHVCLLGTHVTYQRRSVVRELGKVFGLPKEEIDEIVDEPARFAHRDHITELIFRYADRIKDLPSNISIHAGGVLITEKPIYSYTTLAMPPKGLPVSHFDMHSAEDIGIFKFDILSQRGLGHLKETMRHVKRNQGIEIDINRFHDFKHDEAIKELMRTGKTTGCFYVESPAMRMLLGKLHCDDYLTLVAASSIIRPGVARSGMMRAYIERFHLVRQGKSYDVIHPKIDELMKETYGVMVYQEDVIKVAHEFAGLTLTEADVLRRGMSGKFRSREEFARVREAFFQKCHQRGYDPAITERVWYEIESFSGYSFAKGHSASYAVESYQSLYLKAYFPLEFMVGVINNFGGFYKTEFYFHEARMSGGIIEPPCVNHSDYLTTIEGRTLFIGFIHLKGLETSMAKSIAAEREQHGNYTSLENFMQRVPAGLEQVRILIRMGSFRFTGKTKQQLLWEAMLFANQSKHRTPGAMLFNNDAVHYPLPELQRNQLEDAFDEIELLGFPLCDPFTLVDTNDYGSSTARELMHQLGNAVSILGYVITTKDTSTLKGAFMHFGTFYDRHGEVFDTVHFPDSARQYPFRGRGFYRMHGRVVEDFGVPMVEVSRMEKIPLFNKRELPPNPPQGPARGGEK